METERPGQMTLPKLLAGLLLLLLLTVETSVQTSLAFDRGSAFWSPWLFKLGPVTVADCFIMLVTAFCLIVLAADARIRPPVSAYTPLVGLLLIYVGIGIAYNLAVYTFWKGVLYDFKIVLYLTTPYVFLYICRRQGLLRWFRPTWIFALNAAAALIDVAIVSLFGSNELPTYSGLLSLPTVVPAVVCIAGMIYAADRRTKIAFAALFAFEIFNMLNRIAGAIILETAMIVPYLLALSSRRPFWARFALVLTLFVVENALSVAVIFNPLHLPIFESKIEGVVTRAIQLQNLALNFNENIPGAIGKGLGSTWFEHVPVPANDVYSVGTSLGETAEESLGAPVKFIFNVPTGSTLYKWGIVGAIALIYLLTRYYACWDKKLREIAIWLPGDPRVGYLRGALFVSFFFALRNLTYIGFAKQSLMTALLVFFAEHEIAKLWKSSRPEGGMRDASLE